MPSAASGSACASFTRPMMQEAAAYSGPLLSGFDETRERRDIAFGITVPFHDSPHGLHVTDFPVVRSTTDPTPNQWRAAQGEDWTGQGLVCLLGARSAWRQTNMAPQGVHTERRLSDALQLLGL